MAEASENLQAVMARHPEIKKLAEQKEAMRQALISKGIDADNVTDFEKYAAILKTFNFSIDSTIESNGYTYNVGTDEEPVTLSTMMAKDLKHNAILKDKTAYTASDFRGDTSITYLNVKPMSGSLAGFCNGATNLKYVPQLDFSEVTSLYWAFYGTSRMFVHDEYTVDLAKCSTMQYSQWQFAKKLILENMSSTCICDQLCYRNTVVECVEGLNVSYAQTRINVLFNGASSPTSIKSRRRRRRSLTISTLRRSTPCVPTPTIGRRTREATPRLQGRKATTASARTIGTTTSRTPPRRNWRRHTQRWTLQH